MPFKVTSEEKSHFVCEGDRGSFKIAKKGLHPKRVAHLQSLCHGGKVQKMDEGGEVLRETAKQELQAEKDKDWAAEAQAATPDWGAVGKAAADPSVRAQVARQFLPVYPEAGSLGAKAISYGLSKIPTKYREPAGSGSYEEELARYNAEAPTSHVGTVANIASNVVPAGTLAVAGARALRAGMKARKAVGTVPWGSMALDEALDAAHSGAHLIQDKAGQFIGAPRGIDTPEKLAALRQTVDAAVQDGGFGAGWYARARDAIDTVVGGDKKKADELAKLLAVTSPSTGQQSNVGMALGAWNRGALEGAESVAQHPEGFRYGGAQAKAASAALSNPASEAGLGEKTSAFYRQLSPAQANEDVVRAVNDLWTGRGYGYENVGKKVGKPFERAFSESEHSFLTGEQLLAAERAHLSVPQAQERMWMGLKKQAEVARGQAPGEAERIAQEGPAEFLAGKESPFVANETTEATPGAPGHLQGLANQPALNERFSRDPRASYLDPQGRDMFYKAEGMLQTPAEPGVGEWTPPGGPTEYNPNLTLHPLVSYRPGHTAKSHASAGPQLDVPSKTMVEQTNAWRSALDAQHSGAYNTSAGVGNLRALPWGQEGSGQVTKELTSELDPRIAAKWDRSPELLQRIGEKNALDQETVARGQTINQNGYVTSSKVGPPRSDVALLRRILSRGGWGNLHQYIQEHGYEGLPGLAVGTGAAAAAAPEQDAKGGEVGRNMDSRIHAVKMPDGTTKPIVKSALSPAMRARVQNLADGGEVEPDLPETTPPVVPPFWETDLGRGLKTIGHALMPSEGPKAPETPLTNDQLTILANAGNENARAELRDRQGVLDQPAAPPTPEEQAQHDTETQAKVEAGAPLTLPPQEAPTLGTPALSMPQGPPKPSQPAVVQKRARPQGMTPGGGPIDKQINSFTKEAEHAYDLGAQVATAESEARTAAHNQFIEDSAAATQDFTQKWQANQSRVEQMRQDILNSKVDPNRLWHDASTGQKMAASIGIVLSGIGQGLSAAGGNRGTPNVALAMIDKMIDRDLEAQKLDLGKKQSIMSSYVEQGHDLVTAHQMARADLSDLYGATLAKASTQYGDQKAQAAREMEISQLHQNAFTLRQQAYSTALQQKIAGLQANALQIQQQYMQWKIGVAQKEARGQPLSAEELRLGVDPQEQAKYVQSQGGYRPMISPDAAKDYRESQVLTQQIQDLLAKPPEKSWEHRLSIPWTSGYKTVEEWRTRVSDLLAKAYGNKFSPQKLAHFQQMVNDVGDPSFAGSHERQLQNLREMLASENQALFGTGIIGGQ